MMRLASVAPLTTPAALTIRPRSWLRLWLMAVSFPWRAAGRSSSVNCRTPRRAD
jgi:hypothetical protein